MKMVHNSEIITKRLSYGALVCLIVSSIVGVWAAFWGTCLEFYGYRFTETIVSHYGRPNGSADRLGGVLSTVRMENDFGHVWERSNVGGLGSYPVGTHLIIFEARNRNDIIPDPPTARGEFWSMWGLTVLAGAWAVGMGVIYFLLGISRRSPLLALAVLLGLVWIGGILGPETVRSTMDARRVMKIAGFEKWTPERANSGR